LSVGLALLKLLRLDTAFVAFLAIFIPVLARSNELSISLRRAIPMLFIGMCTYIANDLDDVERDRINHPERPLPKGNVALPLAATLYFVCLASALLTIRAYVPLAISFGYYFLLAVAISYRYVVDLVPSIKAFYVAAAFAVPALIVASYYPAETKFCFVAASVFSFTLGKELCMDVLDRPGDTPSVLHRIDAKVLVVVAFIMEATGLLLLSRAATRGVDAFPLLLMAGALYASATLWFSYRRPATAIQIMRLQFVLGLWFVV